ncbi:hypothetical protein WR25_23343 [Diploscapter pachys]|uniref:MSP domain-containing protein n=1 Tax=Diploscapter pachys TaxID=2018661 RepID=A0A2A2K218_9BILA|nr:hypothetical protein WR25_23343 [Diploscapter pachys]
MQFENDGQVPVFLSTGEIEFHADEARPRSVFTLYNPFGYDLSYKVLCTAPQNYIVSDCNGFLKSKCCKDIVVRVRNRLPVGTIDRLKVEIRKFGDTELHGHRIIDIRIVDVIRDRTGQQFQGMGDSTSSLSGVGMQQSTSSQYHHRDEHSQWAFVLAAFLCALALLAPTHGDAFASQSIIPHVLHLSVPQKLVAAYILGIVTILILRP